jgi:hypothetical protein
VSIFIISTFIFFILAGSGFGTPNSNFESNAVYEPKYIPYEIEHYTYYNDMIIRLQNIANEYDNIVELYSNLGKSYEERIIWVMKISDNPNVKEDEPEVLFVGAHHGNEAIGNEMALYIIDTFTTFYGKDPRITWLVDNHEIWVVPMPNPDGLEYTLNDNSWRKNRSPNYISEVTPGPFDPKLIRTSYGTDLNRNYDMEWGDPDGSAVLLQRSGTYAGSEPFSELETQALRDLSLAHNFSVYVDYHSGIEMILYPWGYTSDPTPDNVLFERVAAELERLTGVEERQGYDLYQTNGDSLDWVYFNRRSLAFTVELSVPKMPEPNELLPILENHIQIPLYLTGISGDKETGSQINIIHENIENQTDFGPYKVSTIINGVPLITDLNVELHYRVNQGDYEVIQMENSIEKPYLYEGNIPTQGPESVVSYYIAVGDGNVMVCSPNYIKEYEFNIEPLPESITTDEEIVAMVIMMIIILGFFWGGFSYCARLALLAERRKLHEYYYGENY